VSLTLEEFSEMTKLMPKMKKQYAIVKKEEGKRRALANKQLEEAKRILGQSKPFGNFKSGFGKSAPRK
jgi:hypothetical protein